MLSTPAELNNIWELALQRHEAHLTQVIKEYRHHTYKAFIYNIAVCVLSVFVILHWFYGKVPFLPTGGTEYGAIYTLLWFPSHIWTFGALCIVKSEYAALSLGIELFALLINAWACFCLRNGPYGVLLCVMLSQLFRINCAWHQAGRLKSLNVLLLRYDGV